MRGGFRRRREVRGDQDFVKLAVFLYDSLLFLFSTVRVEEALEPGGMMQTT
jgi:hypothetical protein